MAKRSLKPPEFDADKGFSFETFRKPGGFEVSSLSRTEPNAFNGIVQVVKYRVTVERVEEPDAVIRARIGKLWNECKNHHQWEPLRKAAAQYGMKLEVGKEWQEGDQ